MFEGPPTRRLPPSQRPLPRRRHSPHPKPWSVGVWIKDRRSLGPRPRRGGDERRREGRGKEGEKGEEGGGAAGARRMNFAAPSRLRPPAGQARHRLRGSPLSPVAARPLAGLRVGPVPRGPLSTAVSRRLGGGRARRAAVLGRAPHNRSQLYLYSCKEKYRSALY